MATKDITDSILTQLATAYFQDNANDYVFHQTFTPIDVNETTGRYNTFTRDDILRNEAAQLANGQMAPVADFGISEATFATIERGIGVPVNEADITDFAKIGDLREAANRIATTKTMIRAERDFVGTAFTTGVWTTTKQGGADFTKFSDYASSDPEKVINDYISTMEGLTGRRPNTITLPANVYRTLRAHPSLKSNYIYSNGGIIGESQLREIFDVEKIVVSRSIYHSNNEGGTATPGFTVPKAILLTYTEAMADKYSESAGYTFQVDGVMGYNKGFRTIVDDTTSKKQDIVEVDYRAAFKVTGADLGIYLYDVIA
jgi:hypothetical protein